MIMVLTETNNQHRQRHSYGSGWFREPQQRAERQEWKLQSVNSGSKERKGQGGRSRSNQKSVKFPQSHGKVEKYSQKDEQRRAPRVRKLNLMR